MPLLPLPLPAPQVQEAPAPLGVLLQQAREAREAGRFPAALAAYEAMLRQVPDHETAQFERAETLAWAGRYAEALDAGTAFRSAHPEQARRADLLLGKVAAWAGRTGDALGHLEPWARQGDRQAVLDAATYEGWGGKTGAALQRLRPWVESHPADREARLLQARLLSWDGQIEASRAAYQRLAADHPGDREALTGLATLALWENQPEQARQAIEAMSPDTRSLPEVRLLGARVAAAQGHPREAQATAEVLARLPGPAQKEAQVFLLDQTEARGPWVELAQARTDSNEGLRVENPSLRARLPLLDGTLDLAGTGDRTRFQAQSAHATTLNLAFIHPLGRRLRATVGVVHLPDLAGEPAWGHQLALAFQATPALSVRAESSRSFATYTPAALALRTAFLTTELGAAYTQARHALEVGAHRSTLSEGSSRTGYFASYTYRLPVTGVDLRAGLLAREFGYSETLPLGFFNPDRFRWVGGLARLGWRGDRRFEASLEARVGQQTVNQDPARTTYGYAASLGWRPWRVPAQLFAAWSWSHAGLPVVDPTDPTTYQEHTLRVGVRVLGRAWKKEQSW